MFRSQVSWFRRKDYLLLTVGLSTYSSDDRFLVEHTRHLGNWALRIKNARKDDEGIYECQLSTHPPESIFIELRIVGEYNKYTMKFKSLRFDEVERVHRGITCLHLQGDSFKHLAG